MSPSSACLETQQSLRARRRQGEKVTGHLVRIDSSSPPRRDKEDILQTKQNTRCSSHFFHIHPGAFSKRHREELLPVFPPKWKELSTIITMLPSALARATMTTFCFVVTHSFFRCVWMQLRRGACSEMSTEEASRSL